MPSKTITSLTNPHVKAVVALRDRKQRAKDGLTIVEGRREVARAIEAGIEVRELYICRELLSEDTQRMGDKAAPRGRNVTPNAIAAGGSNVLETTRAVFMKMAYGDRAEGILAVCAPRPRALADWPVKKTAPLFVVVEAVEKPGNLGAILRTCDGAGVDGVLVCGEKTDVYNPNVIRASLGAVFSVPAAACTNEGALAFLKSRKVKICAALPAAKTLYTKARLNGALAVVVGSEEGGLTPFWCGHAGMTVRIPMRGRADSLNVSASTAVLLYEAVRQRNSE